MKQMSSPLTTPIPADLLVREYPDLPIMKGAFGND